MARRGFRVFPLCENTKRPDGRLGMAPNGFKDATTDLDLIQKWIARYPDSNYGIATGDGVLVLDMDTDAAYTHCSQLGLPETFTVQTRHGQHKFYRVDGLTYGPLNIFNDLTIQTDLRGDGSYVVGPGSNHPEGGRYTMAEDSALASAPPWMVALASPKGDNRPNIAVLRPTEPSDAPMPPGVTAALLDTSDGKHSRLYHDVVKPLIRSGWTDQQIVDVVTDSALMKARVRSGKVRTQSKLRYIEQMLDSARQWLANNPHREDAVNPDEWLAWTRTVQLRKYRRVVQQFAAQARVSPTFVMGVRDMAAAIGCSKGHAERGMALAIDLNLVEVVYKPEPGSLRRRVFRLARPFPVSGTLVVVDEEHSADASLERATALCVPLSGKTGNDMYGHTKQASAYDVMDALDEHQGYTAAEVRERTGYSLSSVYVHLNRAVDTGFAVKRNGRWFLVSKKMLKEAAHVFAETRGMTGWVEGVRAQVRREREARLDARHEHAYEQYGRVVGAAAAISAASVTVHTGRPIVIPALDLAA